MKKYIKDNLNIGLYKHKIINKNKIVGNSVITMIDNYHTNFVLYVYKIINKNKVLCKCFHQIQLKLIVCCIIIK